MSAKPRHLWLTEDELNWRLKQLVYNNTDMIIINLKLKQKAYKSLNEFLIDIFSVHHNVGVFHGGKLIFF